MTICFNFILFVALLVNGATSFNLDSSPNYMTSASGGVLYNESNIPDTAQLGANDRSAYFGFSISMVKNTATGKITMMISSPLSTNARENSGLPDTRPSIHSCPVRGSLFSGITENCTISYPDDSTPGDGFGMAAAGRSDGDALSCSPLRELDCGAMKSYPGFCYKSSDYGKTWKKDKQTEDISCPAGTVDVLFVLDGSGSVRLANFETVKTWVQEITQSLNLIDGSTSVGVVQYSWYNSSAHINNQKYIKTEIEIGSITDQLELDKAIADIAYFQYNTPTGRAMQKVVYDFKGTANYGKKTNNQVMILLTDGKANSQDALILPTAAQALRDLGVVTYAVGVGDSIQESELQIIANGGQEGNNRVIKVTNFDDLRAIVDELGTEITSGILEGGGDTTGDLYTAQTGLASAYSKEKVSGDFGVCRSDDSVECLLRRMYLCV